MICPESESCTKFLDDLKSNCMHSKPHKYNKECITFCSYLDKDKTNPCIDETLVQKTGKFFKLKIREKEIRVWSRNEKVYCL